MASEPVPSRDVGKRTSRVVQPVMVMSKLALRVVISMIAVVVGGDGGKEKAEKFREAC